jgi:TPR repeat protein
LVLITCQYRGHTSNNTAVGDASIDEILKTLEGQPDFERNADYEDALDVLFNLGIYEFDPNDLSACDNDDLRPYYLQRQIPNNVRQEIDENIDEFNGDDVFSYLLNIAEMASDEREIEITSFMNVKASEKDILYEKLLTYLIWVSSQRGSVDGLNEIGAAQIYCYQNTEQDILGGVRALEKAVSKGDPLAMMTLGKVYYTGMGEYSDKELGIKLQDKSFELIIEQLKISRSTILKDLDKE